MYKFLKNNIPAYIHRKYVNCFHEVGPVHYCFNSNVISYTESNLDLSKFNSNSMCCSLYNVIKRIYLYRFNNFNCELCKTKVSLWKYVMELSMKIVCKIIECIIHIFTWYFLNGIFLHDYINTSFLGNPHLFWARSLSHFFDNFQFSLTCKPNYFSLFILNLFNNFL